MIAYLRGEIIKQEEKFVVLDVNGVGYKVYCNTLHHKFSGLEKEELLKNGNLTGDNNRKQDFFIHTVVREDALELFGFFDELSLKLFEKLINISGIGPRSALAIVNVGTIESLTEAINKGDLGYLTAVSGIGKKTAEKIVLELRGQVSDLILNDTNNEVVQALKAMGYTERDAQMAAKNTTGTTVNEKIKNALKSFGK
jgi:Holliday junction DNA helicase RuvA